MFIGEMIAKSPRPIEEKKVLTKMARMARWLADLADPQGARNRLLPYGLGHC